MADLNKLTKAVVEATQALRQAETEEGAAADKVHTARQTLKVTKQAFIEGREEFETKYGVLQ